MKINFTLVGIGCTGGVKTFFELSDILIRKGHEVYITTLGGNTDWVTNKNLPKVIVPKNVQNNNIFSICYKKINENKVIKKTIKKIAYDLFPNYIYCRNIKITDRNNETFAATIPDCDINVATYHSTAYAVFNGKKGIPVYYIQHFEPYFYPNNAKFMKKYALDTYFLKMNRIS